MVLRWAIAHMACGASVAGCELRGRGLTTGQEGLIVIAIVTAAPSAYQSSMGRTTAALSNRLYCGRIVPHIVAAAM